MLSIINENEIGNILYKIETYYKSNDAKYKGNKVN